MRLKYDIEILSGTATVPALNAQELRPTRMCTRVRVADRPARGLTLWTGSSVIRGVGLGVQIPCKYERVYYLWYRPYVALKTEVAVFAIVREGPSKRSFFFNVCFQISHKLEVLASNNLEKRLVRQAVRNKLAPFQIAGKLRYTPTDMVLNSYKSLT